MLRACDTSLTLNFINIPVDWSRGTECINNSSDERIIGRGRLDIKLDTKAYEHRTYVQNCTHDDEFRFYLNIYDHNVGQAGFLHQANVKRH